MAINVKRIVNYCTAGMAFLIVATMLISLSGRAKRDPRTLSEAMGEVDTRLQEQRERKEEAESKQRTQLLQSELEKSRSRMWSNNGNH